MRVLFLPSVKASDASKKFISRLIIETGCTLVSWNKDITSDDFDIQLACTDTSNEEDINLFLENNDELTYQLLANTSLRIPLENEKDNPSFTVGRGIYENFINNNKLMFLCTAIEMKEDYSNSGNVVFGFRINHITIDNSASWIDYGVVTPLPYIYNIEKLLSELALTTIPTNNNLKSKRRILKWN